MIKNTIHKMKKYICMCVLCVFIYIYIKCGKLLLQLSTIPYRQVDIYTKTTSFKVLKRLHKFNNILSIRIFQNLPQQGLVLQQSLEKIIGCLLVHHAKSTKNHLSIIYIINYFILINVKTNLYIETSQILFRFSKFF